MPADWSVTPQDQQSIVITPVSPESLGVSTALFTGVSFLSTAWATGNLALYIPFVVSVPTTIVAGAIYNGTSVAGNFDIGVYDDQQNRLVSAGTTAVAGTTAWQSVSLTSTTLDPGVYYTGITCSSTSNNVWAATAGTASNLRAAGILSQTSALPLPATATFAVGTGTLIPLVALSTRTWI